MSTPPRVIRIACLAAFAALLPGSGHGQAFTNSFPLKDCTFVSEGTNPFYPLIPGRVATYDNRRCVAAGDCDEQETLVITTLEQTRDITLRIGGGFKTVRTRVLREAERANGEVIEISRNFFAECKATRDVYYFGETVDIFEEDGTISHDGAWIAGRNDARPGLVMPGGAILVGSRYFQEVAPGVALDRAEHLDGRLDITVPAGTFENCLEVEETTPLEPGQTSRKVYCPGVGMVIDNDLELLSLTGAP